MKGDISDKRDFLIVVPAEIKEITSPVEEDAGGTAFFTCEAEARPITDNMISWTRENFDMTKTKQTYEDGKGFLTVYELEKMDSGDFTCHADNGLGEPVTKTASLLVLCKLRSQIMDY